MGLLDFFKKQPVKEERVLLQENESDLFPFIPETEHPERKSFAIHYKKQPGKAILSANGNYQLFWANNTVSLFKDREKLLEKNFRQPLQCTVADNGTFVVNDALRSDLESTFFVHDADGTLLLEKYYHANLYFNGISLKGKYAVCQTCNNPQDLQDSSVLNIFDLTENKELLKIKNPKKYWATYYEFDLSQNKIHLYSFEKQLVTYDLLQGKIIEDN